jgi:Glycosyltransferase family 87
MPSGPSRLARFVAAVGLVVLTLIIFRQAPTGFAQRTADAWVYLAAGERLNSGHDLYALGPGDREVVLAPPLITSPRMSPPPVAVAWRPLALIGEVAMGASCAGAIISSLAVIVWGIRFGGPISLAAVVLLGPVLLYAAVPGNANAFLAPVLSLAWLQRRRHWLPALAVVAATAVKVTPVALGPWALPRDRLAWTAALAVVGVTLTLVGAPGGRVPWSGGL